MVAEIQKTMYRVPATERHSIHIFIYNHYAYKYIIFSCIMKSLVLILLETILLVNCYLPVGKHFCLSEIII